jgi:choline dehydrogenase-like flavoprotein
VDRPCITYALLYIDRVTREVREVYARVVVLSAQALESVRILLNSKSEQDPGGLANSSGVLGHYLMDHNSAGGAYAEFPELAKYEKPSVNGPNRPDGIYVIRFRNTKDGPRSKRFLRGYGFQGGGDANFHFRAPGFGEAYKKAVLEPLITFGLGAFGECLPYYDNYVEIDKNVNDGFGIPVLKFHMTWRENERAMTLDIWSRPWRPWRRREAGTSGRSWNATRLRAGASTSCAWPGWTTTRRSRC